MIVISIVTYFVFFQLPFVHSHSIPEGWVSGALNLIAMMKPPALLSVDGCCALTQ